MGKRGPKRRAGARYASGDLKPAIDRGTPEQQSRKAWAAGSGDPNLVWHVIGVLRAQDQIDEDQYATCSDYRRCYSIRYRKPDLPAVTMDGMPKGRGGGPSDDDLKRAKAKLTVYDTALDSVVLKHGRAAKDVWSNICVFDRFPRFMQPVFKRASDLRESQLFEACLKAVVAVREKADRAARDAVKNRDIEPAQNNVAQMSAQMA